MILCLQSQVTPQSGQVNAVAVEFWLEQLTRLARWQHERCVLYAIDHLLRTAFTSTEARGKVQEFFSKLCTVSLSFLLSPVVVNTTNIKLLLFISPAVVILNYNFFDGPAFFISLLL